MAVDDRLSDLLVEWEQGRRSGQEPSVEELCRDTPELLPVVRESIDSLRATAWMFEPQPTEPFSSPSAPGDPGRAALHDTELPASHLTAQEFAASIFQSGLLSREEIEELRKRLDDSALPGEAREIASKLVSEGKLTRYQAAVLLKASKDPLLIDNYVILDTLDTGGMGLVFKALHRSMNRVVALKLLPAAMMSARDTVKRFQREVQAAAALKHPNVVAAYDADESEEIAYLVLEYVDGTNLYRLVKEQGPQPLAEAVDFVRQAAAGLSYLHSRGIIHRDVKPANLLLAKDGTVKLLDMGLVRFASSEDLSCSEMDQELTQAGIVIGTVAYMSPEQALDTRSADQRSDIYSLGCTLFYLLTGRSLYHEETGMKTLLAHREQPVPSLREFCEEAPVSLDAVFRTMVAKRPADRLRSMDEVIAALDACVPRPAAPTARAGRLVPSAPPLRTGTRPGPVWKSRRFRIAAAVTALAAAVIGGIYLAVIVIRIKTSQGTAEISVNDPNAKIEIATQPSGPAVSQLQPPPIFPLHPPSEAGSVVVGGSTRRGRPRGLKFGGTGVFSGTQPAATTRPPVPVVTATVRKGDFDVYLSGLPGAVSAPTNVAARTRVDGVIQDVPFVEGQIVRAGQTLFRIDDRQYKTRLAEAEARLARDQAALAEAKQESDHRQPPAVAKATPAHRDKGRNKAASDPIKAAENAIRKDRELLNMAKQELSECQITAPISGRIGLRYVDKGSVVSADQTGPLAFITPLEPVTVLFSLPLDQVYQVQQKLDSGKAVVAEAWDQNSQVKLATGKLTGTNNQANPVSGTVQAKCLFANEGNRLFPFEPVKVRFLVDTLHDVVTLPTEAIQHRDRATFVFVVKPDQTVEERLIQIGPEGKGQTVVRSDLSPGELVVVAGTDKLSDGFKVAVQNPTAKTTGNLDRQVADWVLANRGTVTLKEFRGRTFQFVDALPPTDFHIVMINLKDYVSDDTPSAAPADDAGPGRRGSGGLGFRGRRFRNRPTAGSDQTGRTFHRVEFSEADLDRLASLTELRWLYFASSAVTDDVLARLKGLTRLESLGLEGASITDTGLGSLLGMPHLTNLDLDSTAITDAGLKEIAKLKSLNDLNLIPETERSGRVPRTVPCLRLNQTGTTVNGIDELQRALPHCIVFASHLSGFTPAPPALGSSDRDWAQWVLSQVQGSMRHVSTDLDPETSISSYDELPPVDFHIVQLNFGSDFGISETMLRRMSGLSKLRSLYFKKLPAQFFAGLGDLKQLELLWIDETDATDDVLGALGNLTRLKTLRLGDKYLADRDLARLAPLSNLTSLSLDGHSKGVNGSGFGALSGLTHLKMLDLDGSGIEDETMAPIGKLVSLEVLGLSETWVTGKGLSSLASLSQLKHLRLNGCRRLEMSSLELLSKFPHLESLSLSNSPLDDRGVEALIKLTSLRELLVDPSHLSPTAYKALFQSLPNCNINGSRPYLDKGFQRQSQLQAAAAAATATSTLDSRRRRKRASDANQLATSGSRNEVKLPNGPRVVGGPSKSAAEAVASGLQKLHKLSPEVEMLDRMNKETSADRAIAVWVQTYEGAFDTDKTEVIRTKAAIPAGDFHLVSISLYDSPGDRDGDALPRAQQRVQFPEAVLSRLAQLTHLQVLTVDCRECTDATLKTIGKIASLKALHLRHSGITDAGLASLGGLKQLALLDLRHTVITDKGLLELAKIKLFSGVRPLLRPASMPPFQPQLWIDFTPTTEAGVVEFQKSVPNCLISAAHLMDFKPNPIAAQQPAQWVAPFPPAAGSPDREWADWLFAYVRGCRILTDADPETWFDNRMALPPIDFHITQIEVGGQAFETPHPDARPLVPLVLRHFADLPQLERLALYSQNENLLPAVATLKQLKWLALRNVSSLGDEALKSLGTMTNLEKLGIESDQLTDTGLKYLSNLPHLIALDLVDDRNVHGSGLRNLRASTKLEGLGLSNSGIDDAGLAEVAQFPNLQTLHLNKTWISPKGLAELARLAKLKHLELIGCRRINDSAFAELRKLKSLTFLNLDDTRVTGAHFAELRKWFPNCVITLPAQVRQLPPPPENVLPQ